MASTKQQQLQRAVVAIGVKKTGGLPELQAARESAAAIAAWAHEHQKIPASRVKLITDAKSRVTRDRIFDTIEKITELGFIEQLIVYFSGHGINSGLYEQWLLSRAPDDPAAAVNLRGSEMLARFCGIGHVVFISDACRTAADSIQAQGVTGGEIFPNPKARGVENPVDQYFATLVGNPAYEVKTVADAVSRYRAAYSTVLLDALNGNVPALIEAAASRRVIRPRPLKMHLTAAVPAYMRTLKLAGGETQQPDARIESDPGAWVAQFPPVSDSSSPAPTSVSRSGPKRRRGSAAPREKRPALTGTEDLLISRVLADARRPVDLESEAKADLAAAIAPAGDRRKRGPAPGRRQRAAGAVRDLLDRTVAHGEASFGPDHFETECGIKLRGARVVEAYARHAGINVGNRRDVVQVNLEGRRRGANVLVRLGDGSAVVVPAFRGFLTGLTFNGDGNLDDVRCEPSANTGRWHDWQATGGELRNLRSVIAGASSLGVFRLDGPAHAEGLLNRMRRVKGLDPAMAVYAAYALHDRRMRTQIIDMQRYLDNDLGLRIFDVAMLAFSLGRRRPRGAPREMYPCVPMLTQGWALLGPMGVSLPGRLGELRGHLRPSLWTHFSPAAADAVIDTFKNAEVD